MKIQTIDSFPVYYPTVGRFKFFEGAEGQPLGRAAVLIKITSDDGTVGWGESVPVPKWTYETLESVTDTVQRYFAPALLNIDPCDLESVHRIMNTLISPGYTTGMPLAKAGIDIALHDLIGKAMGVSLAQRWGRSTKEKLKLSWTLNPASLDQLDLMISEGWERGFRHFNVKVAPDPHFDIELCRRVKERVPNGFLWADANGGYDLATAKEVAPKLADVGVDVLEAPIRPNELSGYRELKKQGALPIIMDEGVISPRELIEFMKLKMLDGVAMKPSRCGGLVSAKHQIEILRDAGMIFLGSGLTDPDISLAASLALFGAYDLSYPAALNGPQFLDYSVLKQPLKPINGFLTVPTGNGLGIEVDETRLDAIRRYDVFS